MQVRAICVGVDLYEIQVKTSFLSSWKTVYNGSLPLRVSRKNINKVINQLKNR